MSSGGENKHQPSNEARRLVWIMSASGTPRADMARVLGITQPTLRKHYKHELENGKNEATANITGQLYKQAMQGNVRAIMFWLRCQAGWRETERHEVTGANGAQINTDVRVRFGDDDAANGDDAARGDDETAND